MEVIGAKLVHALQQRNHDVCVVTDDDGDLPDQDYFESIPIKRFPFRRALSERDARLVLGIQKGIADLKRRFRPDIVHINFSDPSALFHLRSESAYSSKTVVTLHVMIRGPIGEASMLGDMLRRADWTIAVSEAVLKNARDHVPAITDRSSVILNGIELSDAPAPHSDTNGPRLLCVGRMVHDKGFDTAIRAFSQLASLYPQLRLSLAGDGPERARLEYLAGTLGLAERIDFLGWVDPRRIPELMAAASVVFMPTRSPEPFGLVAIEAAQMARPVIGTTGGGLDEIVEDGVTGILARPDDVGAFARAAGAILADPAAAERMGLAARDRIRAKFGWQQHVSAYDCLYRDLTGEMVHAG
jgi:glycogen(starch) synthase